MLVFAASLALMAGFYCSDAQGQVVTTAPGAQPQGTQKLVQQHFSQDGGTTEVLESIEFRHPTMFLPSPFEVATSFRLKQTRRSSMTMENERHIARDCNGRIYQERWYLVPKNGKLKSEMNVIQIADPNTYTAYKLLHAGRTSRCGNPIPGRLEQDLNTKEVQQNQVFHVRTLEPLEAGDGIYLPSDASIRGHVSRVESAGVTGKVRIWLTFDELHAKFGALPIVAEVVSGPGHRSIKSGPLQEGVVEGRSSMQKDAAQAAAAGAAGGAVKGVKDKNRKKLRKARRLEQSQRTW